MTGSKIAPWLSIFAGLLWFYAAFAANERRTLSISLGVVFLLVGLAQLKINQARFKRDVSLAEEKDGK